MRIAGHAAAVRALADEGHYAVAFVLIRQVGLARWRTGEALLILRDLR